ncbi:uncharacterized protein LOC127254159 [Andrographis paniculata]|uniref:uncharacterized protein LOC127254159 n=1 Tax=Andrographis paniculata TaxID=175694 RepID=UPI0021E888ED|nr:uncharacterized protein LOC127254159 [Andrographis paniculata]XP_051135048.1 uncharacterized protein LOC127254159 [Andrographis paniculata]
MLVKNVMENNLLNFDQPFLSVRRSTPALPPEQRDTRKTNVSHPAIPRLPPHRSELKSGPIRNPGLVPFLWEQTPGRPKEEAKPDNQNHDRPPKLPPGRYVKPNKKDGDKLSTSSSVGKNEAVIAPPSENQRKTLDVFDEKIKVVERSKGMTVEKESSDSGDSDAFVDALDTLSRTESNFLNCSISGLHELDNLDVDSSGIFSTDRQAQKFMMDRFLPAAKAMASDTVHYTPKKQPVVQDQPKKIDKGVNQYKPSLRYGPSFAKRYSEYCENEEEEEEDSEEDDDDDHQAKLPSACGLLPRFCFKGSIGRLNPVPGMSVRTRAPISSDKTRLRSSSSGSCSEMDNESKSNISKNLFFEEAQPAEFIERKTPLRNAKEQFESRITATYSHANRPFLETKVLSGSEEQKYAIDNDSSQYGKGLISFQEALADQDSLKKPNSGSCITEKTLYIDTVQNLESPNRTLHTSDTQDSSGLPRLDQDHEITTKKIDRSHVADSTAIDSKRLDDVNGEEKHLPNAHKCDGSIISSSFDEPNGEHMMETPNAWLTTGTTEPVKTATENLKNQLPGNTDLLTPPPLPKSPSDSWLLRTLPSISKNSSKIAQSHGPDAPIKDVKWETMVKATISTKLQPRHLHGSVGMLAAIPEA